VSPTDLGCCWLSGTADGGSSIIIVIRERFQLRVRLIPILKLRLEQTKKLQHRQARDTYCPIQIYRYRYTRAAADKLFFFGFLLLLCLGFAFLFFSSIFSSSVGQDEDVQQLVALWLN